MGSRTSAVTIPRDRGSLNSIAGMGEIPRNCECTASPFTGGTGGRPAPADLPVPSNAKAWTLHPGIPAHLSSAT